QVLLEDRIDGRDRQVNSTSVPNGNTSRPLQDNRKSRSLHLLAAGACIRSGYAARLPWTGLGRQSNPRRFPPDFPRKSGPQFFSLRYFIKFIVHFARPQLWPPGITDRRWSVEELVRSGNLTSSEGRKER